MLIAKQCWKEEWLKHDMELSSETIFVGVELPQHQWDSLKAPVTC